MSQTPPVRRTQRERREHMIARLVEATIGALSDIGYARTTAHQIITRAGVSHGALFRHFDTLLDLIVAAAEEVARREIMEFHQRFAAIPDGANPLGTAIRELRELTRLPINHVWHELMIAARTDAELRSRLQPVFKGFYEEIAATAQRIPGSDAFPMEIYKSLVFTVIHIFNDEALTRSAYAMPELEEIRLWIITEIFVGQLMAGPES